MWNMKIMTEETNCTSENKTPWESLIYFFLLYIFSRTTVTPPTVCVWGGKGHKKFMLDVSQCHINNANCIAQNVYVMIS